MEYIKSVACQYEPRVEVRSAKDFETPSTREKYKGTLFQNFCRQRREANASNERISTKMRFWNGLLTLCFAFAGVNAQEAQDKCPKNEYACLDVINSSQCISQLVIQRLSPLTREAMIKCVDTEDVASNLPAATKVSSNNSYARPLKNP
jgi:hypothetical protein